MFWKSVLIFLFTGLFIRSLSAQNNFYTQSWKKVDSLLNKKGLTQSALETVTSIYNRAQKEKNNAQLIKALIYRIGLRASTEMNATDSAIASIESEIKRIPEPASSILRSIEAEMLWNYYSQNRWKLNDRTPTLHFNKKDISSWDAEDFFKKISELYLSSLTNFKLVQQTRLDAYDPILIKGNSRDLRPTLFDLLGHRALDFFKNDEIDLTRPSYNFELGDETVFADKNIFVSHRFSTQDSLSNHFKA
ncbi:MAG TPA: alpha-2-macroglobulin, partial [Puia sp.]|nr:alpha-2-macroglobulin [Puia sp.]